MTKTKHDLVELIYNTLQVYSKRDASTVVEAFFNLIKEELEGGAEVILSGFGKFRVINKNQRMGRNPRTGELTVITPRHVVTFKPSVALRKRINNR